MSHVFKALNVKCRPVELRDLGPRFGCIGPEVGGKTLYARVIFDQMYVNNKGNVCRKCSCAESRRLASKYWQFSHTCYARKPHAHTRWRPPPDWYTMSGCKPINIKSRGFVYSRGWGPLVPTPPPPPPSPDPPPPLLTPPLSLTPRKHPSFKWKLTYFREITFFAHQAYIVPF